MNDKLLTGGRLYRYSPLAKFDESLRGSAADINKFQDCSITVSKRDAIVKITNPLTNLKTGGGKRDSIKQFSRASQLRLLYKVRNMAHMNFMCTLTYHNDFPLTGKSCKYHWKLLKQKILRKYPDSFGLWFFEFQMRGAPHFHFFTNANIDNNWLRSEWQKITGDSTILCVDVKRCTRETGAASYAAKIYSAKSEQKHVPENFHDVGRFWGVFGDPNIKKHEKTLLPKNPHAVDLVDLVRLIRRFTKAQRRSFGEKYKTRGQGKCGFTAYDVSSVIFRFLDIDRTLLGDHFEFSLLSPH
jgi:hypothetical protein